MSYLFRLPYSFKRKQCSKRIQKRKLEEYKCTVDKIIVCGHAELNGTVFNSVADLTMAFYNN